MHRRFLLVLFTLIFVGFARAGEVEVLPTLEVLPGGPVVGGEAATVVVLTPRLGRSARVKVRTETGEVTSAAVEVADHLVVHWRPPAVSEPTDMVLTVKGRDGRVRIQATATIRVVPTLEGHVSLKLDPPEWRVGAPGVMTVRFNAPIDPYRTSRKIMAEATLGTLSAPVAVGDGSWISRWTPPGDLDDPQHVVITAWDEALPHTMHGWSSFPVLAKGTVTTEAPPGSKNLLEVGGRTYGPFSARADGTVSFEVDLRAENPIGVLTTVPNGAPQSTRKVRLPVGDHGMVLLLPFPAKVPADRRITLPLRIAVLDERGQPDRNTPVLTATSGKLGRLLPVGSDEPGVYATTWTAPDLTGVATISASATWGTGEDALTRTTARTVDVLPRVPTIALSIQPTTLPFAGGEATVVARVREQDGRTLPEADPGLSLAAADKTGGPGRGSDGSWLISGKIWGKAPRMFATAEATTAPTGLLPVHLSVWPVDGTLSTAAPSTTSVGVVAVDVLGVPVPGVDVRLTVEKGTGTFSSKGLVRTDDHGVGRIVFTAGLQAGPVIIRADGAGLVARSQFLLVDGPTAAGIPLASGSDSWQHGRSVGLGVGPLVSAWREPPPVVAVASEESSAGSAGRSTRAASGRGDSSSRSATRAGRSSTDRASSDGPAFFAMDPAWMRGSMGLGLLPHAFDQNADPGGLPIESAHYSNIGGGKTPLGGDLRFLAWPGDAAFGIDARGSLYKETTEAEDQDFSHVGWDAKAGLRYRLSHLLEQYSLAPYAVLQAHRFHETIFVWKDTDFQEPGQLKAPFWGGRVGAGLSLDTGRIYAEGELAETFAPFPVLLSWGLAVELAIADPVSLRLAYDGDVRTMAFVIDSHNVELTGSTQALTAGFSFTLR